MTNQELIKHLEDLGYKYPKMLDEYHWVAIQPFLFTYGIIFGSVDNIGLGYDDRWCYKDLKTAKLALDIWDGTGEPTGWHRHPTSGRRREGGNEWVAM